MGRWQKSERGGTVRFKIHFTRILDLPMSFLKRVIEEKLDVLYYPSIASQSGGLCKISKYVPPQANKSARIVLDLNGDEIEVQSKRASVLCLLSGYDYSIGTQTGMYLYLGSEFFDTKEDYAFFVRTRAHMNKKLSSSCMYVAFEIQNGQMTDHGKEMVRQRLREFISTRREWEIKTNFVWK
jgi:hypothetical protein